MAKKYSRLAARYAKALLKAAVEELRSVEACQELGRSLRSFADFWESDRELPLALLNPTFQKTDRLDAMRKVCQALRLPDVTTRFLRVLGERDRLGLLPEIALAFSELADRRSGVMRVEISTATLVDEGEKQEIEQQLQSLMKGKPEFRWTTDDSLLGGMVVRFDGKVVDGSLSGRLEQIEQMLSL